MSPRRFRSPTDRLVVALDVETSTAALRIARRLRGLVRYVKIGSVLFTAEGPDAVRRLRDAGFEIMLDLKFHDIPSTVEKSCRAAVRHRVAMLTVHASGQPEMLSAAVRGTRQRAAELNLHRPRILGVSVLTSVDRSSTASVTSQVIALAQRVLEAGCDGIVASAWEAPAIRRRLGARPLIVCPGIRPLGTAASDQRRRCTPQEALHLGADILVVGRPVTEAHDPRAVVTRLLKEMGDADSC